MNRIIFLLLLVACNSTPNKLELVDDQNVSNQVISDMAKYAIKSADTLGLIFKDTLRYNTNSNFDFITLQASSHDNKYHSTVLAIDFNNSHNMPMMLFSFVEIEQIMKIIDFEETSDSIHIELKVNSKSKETFETLSYDKNFDGTEFPWNF